MSDDSSHLTSQWYSSNDGDVDTPQNHPKFVLSYLV